MKLTRRKFFAGLAAVPVAGAAIGAAKVAAAEGESGWPRPREPQEDDFLYAASNEGWIWVARGGEIYEYDAKTLRRIS